MVWEIALLLPLMTLKENDDKCCKLLAPTLHCTLLLLNHLHVWFWQAEKREERKQRGAEATQTSDARFDARFRLGHGMAGEESQV